MTRKNPAWSSGPTVAPVRSRLLQRRCVCGGHSLSGGACASCRKRDGAPDRSTSMQSAPDTAPRFGHQFGRTRLHAHDSATPHSPETGAAALGKDCYNVNGDQGCLCGTTECNLATGTPDVKPVPNTCCSPCFGNSVDLHEAVHARDIAPCCQKASQAYKAAQDPGKKAAIEQTWHQWKHANRDWLECRAYTESLRWDNEYLAAHCGKKPIKASPGGQTQVETSPSTGNPGVGPASTGANPVPESELAHRWLAYIQPNVDPSKIPSETLEGCCPVVEASSRRHKAYRDCLCASAKPSLADCPF